MHHIKGIPDFEFRSGNVTRQTEFWKFKRDDTCVGLPFQKVRELFLDKQERESSRREAKKLAVENQPDLAPEVIAREADQAEQIRVHGMRVRKRRPKRMSYAKSIRPFNPFAINPQTGEPNLVWED